MEILKLLLPQQISIGGVALLVRAVVVATIVAAEVAVAVTTILQIAAYTMD